MAPGILADSRDHSPSTRPKPKVYLLDQYHPGAIEYCKERFDTILPGDPEHANWKQNAEYLLIRSSYLTAEDIASCPRLKAVGKQGVGIDKIDAKACAERGIKIFNTPGVNAQAVAEIVLTLAMGVARETPHIVSHQDRGVLVPKETCSGLILHKKVLGVVGMGNIGLATARIFRGAFDAELVAYDPFMPEGAWPDLPHRRVKTLEEVLEACDVLTLHIPLTPETRNLISYSQMKLMKSNAILINAARGGIVNEADLERALREGEIWGAGLDCHEQEPPSKEKYGGLWEQRVLSTPHVGAATSQTQMETAIAAVQRVYEYAQSNNGVKA